NLVSTDNGVIMARIRLRKAVLAAQQGEQPDGIDPATHAVRSASIVLPDNVSFYEAAADALVATAGGGHASVGNSCARGRNVTRAPRELGGECMASKRRLAPMAALSVGALFSAAQAQTGTGAFPASIPLPSKISFSPTTSWRTKRFSMASATSASAIRAIPIAI